MSTMIIGLLAETFIHSGTGQNEGAIDLPVAREAATDYPFLPGSSLKGALRDYASRHWNADQVDRCFGKPDKNAGGLLVSDARLLLLPVRSLTASYKWLTCPHLLERLRRDLARAGYSTRLPAMIEPEKGKVFGAGNGRVFLEERQFIYQGPLPENLVGAIKPLIAHDETQQRLDRQVVIVQNDDFKWFARFALAIQARNVLDGDTKQSKNLWYEESLPPDTVMYSILGERIADSGASDLSELIDKEKWFQTGANETVGQGWFALQRVVRDPDRNGGKGNES